MKPNVTTLRSRIDEASYLFPRPNGPPRSMSLKHPSLGAGRATKHAVQSGSAVYHLHPYGTALRLISSASLRTANGRFGICVKPTSAGGGSVTWRGGKRRSEPRRQPEDRHS